MPTGNDNMFILHSYLHGNNFQKRSVWFTDCPLDFLPFRILVNLEIMKINRVLDLIKSPVTGTSPSDVA